MSKPALGPKPSYAGVPRSFSLTMKCPGHENKLSPHLVKRLRMSGAIPPLLRFVQGQLRMYLYSYTYIYL